MHRMQRSWGCLTSSSEQSQRWKKSSAELVWERGARIWCGHSRKSGLDIAGEGERRCQRSYHVEYTGSRPIAEVKPHWAALVLSWVTRWEYAVLLALSLFCLFFFPSSFLSSPSLFYTASKRNRLLPCHSLFFFWLSRNDNL